MIPQVTAAALVAENKQRATPASVDSIPTSANQEDHVSMAAHAARRLLPMADNVAAVIGIELLAAAQGCDFHAPLASSAILERVRALVRAEVPHLDDDRYMAPDIARATALVRSGQHRVGGTAGGSARHRIVIGGAHDPHRQCPHRPRTARHGHHREVLAHRGAAAHADEQPRSRGGGAPGELVVYGGIGRAARNWEMLRPHRRDAAPARGRRDAAGAIGQAGRRVPHACRTRRAC